ncbi:MAG: Rv0623 family protein transcription factor [Acidobacteria bacterium]|jgi:antitoxin VapB|nr:Rv0623 family protein transcription factor [Acidobacteriota bacterium]
MPLNIKNPEVEKLIAEVSAVTGETKTEAVRKALQERKARLAYRISGVNQKPRLVRYLSQEVWPRIPDKELGRRLSREGEEAILGYGKEGV